MRDTTSTIAVSLAGCDLGNSGVSVFMDALLPRLEAHLATRGIRVLIIGTARERLAAHLEHAPGVTIPAIFNRPGLSAAFTLLGAAITARAMGASLLYLPCANRRAALPIVHIAGTVHDLAQFHVDAKYGHLRQVYVQRVLVPLLRSLRVVTAVSQATADDIARFANIPAARIHVVPNGVTLGHAGSVAPDRGAPYLLYPARLEHPGKNHVNLLHAFAKSRASATHRLAFSGADWGAGPRIRETIDALGLGDKVELLGFVSRDELTTRLAHADGVIAAGLLEGFGLPAAEALSLGKPIAASNTGSLPEVVGALGALFDPRDEDSIARALDRIVEDAVLRERCKREGPERAKRFSWDKAASDIGDAIGEALDAAA